jgi:putative RNA 2'-phosphotransferase
MDDQRHVKVSRYLAKHLRHRPERLGLELDAGGWVEVDALLAACRQASFALTHEDLVEVVERNDKRRFALDPTGTRLRANQGHSIDVDLQLPPSTPPAVLYHGTPRTSLTAILAEGLRPMGRHHVHLSLDVATATKVGSRRGRPAVLRVAAAAMHAAGHRFLVTDNEVWLTDHVPPRYLEVVYDHAPTPEPTRPRGKASSA